MDKLASQQRFEALTGHSWYAAVEQYGALQQEAVDAHARYLESLDGAAFADLQALEHDMKMKYEDATAYWKAMWYDLARA